MVGRRQECRDPRGSSAPTSLALGLQTCTITSALFSIGSETWTQVLMLTKKTLLGFIPNLININLIGYNLVDQPVTWLWLTYFVDYRVSSPAKALLLIQLCTGLIFGLVKMESTSTVSHGCYLTPQQFSSPQSPFSEVWTHTNRTWLPSEIETCKMED